MRRADTRVRPYGVKGATAGGQVGQPYHHMAGKSDGTISARRADTWVRPYGVKGALAGGLASPYNAGSFGA